MADADLSKQAHTPVLCQVKKLVEHIEQHSRLDKHLGIDIDCAKTTSVQTRFNLVCSLLIVAPFGGGQPRACPDHWHGLNGQSLAIQSLQDCFDRGNPMSV